MSKSADALIIAAVLGGLGTAVGMPALHAQSPAPALAKPVAAKPAGKAQAAPEAPTPAIALGRPALAEEIAAWNIDVRSDGEGLPEGKGSVKEGEELFLTACATCHGEFGEGAGRWPVLAGGRGTLKSDRPEKTIGSFWPYASTVFDYVHRAMPFGNNLSLTPDQTYAIVAYLLNLNDLVPDDYVLTRQNFPKVELPNQPNFFDDDRETSEKAFWQKDPCMTNCSGPVHVTMRAQILDVTPTADPPKGNLE